jgi:hypothetical protein
MPASFETEATCAICHRIYIGDSAVDLIGDMRRRFT